MASARVIHMNSAKRFPKKQRSHKYVVPLSFFPIVIPGYRTESFILLHFNSAVFTTYFLFNFYLLGC